MTPEAKDGLAQEKARVEQLYAGMASTYGTALELFDVFGRDLVAAAAIQPGEHVLDLACGRGACLRRACAVVGAGGHVLGIDLSPAMVELTGGELRQDGVGNAEVRVGDAEHLELADDSVDVVTCGFAVFHFPEPDVAMTEVRRVLRAGGRFAASTFTDGALDYPWLGEVIDEMGLLGEMRSLPARPMLRAEGLSRILSEIGFERVAITARERRFVFADVDAYLLWLRTRAYGVILNRLDERDLRRFRDNCEGRLQRHRAPDGYELVKRVDFTVAHRG